MPSSKNPLSTISGGAGKLHADIATASSALYNSGGGNSALLAFLNNVVQTEIAIVKVSAPIAAAGQATYDLRLTGEVASVWVGNGGEDVGDLFVVVEAGTDGSPFKEAGTAQVVVASIAGASIGDGFTLADPLTLNFNVALPSSGSFEIWYAVREQIASTTADAYSFPNIRQGRNLPAALQLLLEDLHADTGQAWDGAWDASIEALASSGLDDRYRRSTAIAGSASGVLASTLTANVGDTETVTIDAKVYTFQAALTDVDGNVQIGASQAASLESLRRAVNLDGVAGTDYATSMTLHPTVSAVNTVSQVIVTAKTPGTGGNAIATSDTTSALRWGGTFPTATTLSGGFAFNANIPGAGALATRGGTAPTVQATTRIVDFSNHWILDPHWAHWRAEIAGPDTTSVSNTQKEGGTGFVAISSMRHTTDVNELAKGAYSSGAFRTVYPRNIVADTLNAENVRTRIDPTAAAALNPAAGASSTDRSTIGCNASDFFRNASGNTEVTPGYDLIKVSYTGALAGRNDEVYVIINLLTAVRVFVRTLSGALPAFPTGVATTDCTIQFIKVAMHQGGGASLKNAAGLTLSNGSSLYHAVLPPLTDDADGAGEIAPKAARFLAGARTVFEHRGGPAPHALEWGGFDPTAAGAPAFPGKLRGDGGLDASIVSNTTHGITISATSTTTWHPGIQGSILQVAFTHAAGIITWTLDLDPEYTPVVGERLEILLLPSPTNPGDGAGGTAEVTLAWPVGTPRGFIFEDTTNVDEQLFSSLGWWDATYIDLGGGTTIFLVERRNRQNPTFGQEVPFIGAHNIAANTGGGTLDWRPMYDGGSVVIEFSDNSAYTLDMIYESAGFSSGSDGWQIEIVLVATGTAYTSTFTWPSDFIFSGGDGTLSMADGDIVKFTATRFRSGATIDDWLLTRTDY